MKKSKFSEKERLAILAKQDSGTGIDCTLPISRNLPLRKAAKLLIHFKKTQQRQEK
jgi:hypothetical protein